MVEIFDACFQGLVQLFAWKAFALQLVGIAIGFLVGILPGLGGPVTLALMLPFIFTMTPVEAFSFLLGMAAVTATTGDITSILFGVPGEPITASMLVDGHPMAKKGEAGRALGAALMSSFVGAIFGALCLALFIPAVRPLVLSVGSAQYFMFAMLGLAFLASLTGGSVVKGLTAACLGLLFALVGLDPISGTERYTFETLYLWDGIRLVPATLGLFAIPEIIDMAIARSSIAKGDVGKIGGVLQGVKDTFRHWGLVMRCSVLGTYIGLIPGMGGAISQWISYAHAVQSSPDKDRFGKGAVEGVLGPGAANHSTLGGAMVPTVAFGVPGSVTTAILLGAFLIQGLVPGPPMLTPEAKGGHLSLTFSFVWIIVVSNIITTAICFLFLSKIAKITQVRSSLVIPFVLLLVYIGAYAENNAFGDVIVMLVFGVLGWVMVQTDWPRPPLILGLVLGKLAEQNLFLTIDNYGMEWLGFPSVIVLFALIMLGVLYPLFQRWREKQSQPRYKQLAKAAEPQAEAAGPVSIWLPIFSLFLVALFGWALWQSWDWGFRPGLFPWVVGFLGLPLALLQLNLDVAGAVKTIGHGLAKEGDEEATRLARETAKICAWIAAYFLAIWLLGFSIAVAVTTFLYLTLAKERWLTALLLTLFAWGAFYGLFVYFLHV
ncbi:MAG: tripartite tricarboxylate transporter permease, partial [Hyphomicrobiaceae bacterium]